MKFIDCSFFLAWNAQRTNWGSSCDGCQNSACNMLTVPKRLLQFSLKYRTLPRQTHWFFGKKVAPKCPVPLVYWKMTISQSHIPPPAGAADVLFDSAFLVFLFKGPELQLPSKLSATFQLSACCCGKSHRWHPVWWSIRDIIESNSCTNKKKWLDKSIISQADSSS